MVISFLNSLAWFGLGWSVAVVLAVTLGQWAETHEDRLRDKLLGRRWKSRTPYFVGAFVCAAWLWASLTEASP